MPAPKTSKPPKPYVEFEARDQDVWYTPQGFPLQIHELDPDEWVIVEATTWGNHVEVSQDVLTKDGVERYLRYNKCFN